MSTICSSTYGKKHAQGGAAAPAAGAADPGKAILEAACTTCHGLEGSLASHVYETQRIPTRVLIRNMIALRGGRYRCPDSDTRGVHAEDLRQEAGGGNCPGRTNGCSGNSGSRQGHPGDPRARLAMDLEGLANHSYTSKEPYESLAKSMVAYGAVVTDAQMPALVDYMFKTYGKK